jgi:beta-1,4-mannosyl-glycoprotein beta-1,4-N-acetylglucosaminyltransferase
MTRVVDCTVFFNENDLFRLRFEEMKSRVTDFVVAEATRTHSGMRKGIFFDVGWLAPEERSRVLHFIVDDLPIIERDCVENRWLPEQFQRNSLIRPLMDLGLSDDDIVMISDLDEIPRSSAVQEAIELLEKYEIVIFHQQLKKYFLNNESTAGNNNGPWLGTVACKFRMIRSILPQAARVGDAIQPRAGCLLWGYARELYSYEARVYHAGWHLSSMGGIDAVMTKFNSVAESAGRHLEPVKTAPHGAHNFRAFRQANQEAMQEFLRQYCPAIAPVKLDDLEQLSRFDFPAPIKKDPMSYQALFYLADPLD